MTKTIAIEYASRGITCNVIAPGFIDTDMTRALGEEIISKVKEKIPMGRMGTPEDIAEAVMFFAGSAAYVTGQVLEVNGGLYTQWLFNQNQWGDMLSLFLPRKLANIVVTTF